ncbi:MAG: hypothetical protein RR250_03555 [Akkermansia sp.]
MDDVKYLKDHLKIWIKTTPGMTRLKLATLCGVNKRTLDNWLIKKGVIPDAQKTVLELLISKKKRAKKSSFYKVSLSFTLEEFREMEQYSKKNQLPIKKWLETTIKDIISTPNQQPPTEQS